jgi:1-acyl-sn-glycerol-3-phosphate acyltransferase
MTYTLLRWIAGIALHWFYRDIRLVGKDHIPTDGPLIIAVNHQNALVDSLLVSWLMPRRLALTAKATLADNWLLALVFRLLHVVPLRRVSDEATKDGLPPDRSRNTQAFTEIARVLKQGGAVLIFPEGKSHNESGLEPLKTGLARLALQARDNDGISGLRILPIGLLFEDKAAPDTVAGARVGQAIQMDSWEGIDHQELTAEIAERLRRVSQDAELPSPQFDANSVTKPIALREHLISLAAWWGRLTHHVPVRMARSIALRRSTNADEPAMLTILFGIGLVLVTYAVHLTLIGLIAHSFLAVCLYLIALVNGAYWAAFHRHRTRY